MSVIRMDGAGESCLLAAHNQIRNVNTKKEHNDGEFDDLLVV
jgi:hypothetical protein